MMRSTSAITSGGGVYASTVMPDFGASIAHAARSKIDTGRRPADIRRAQVERLARDVDLDRIEILSVQHLDPHDMCVPSPG